METNLELKVLQAKIRTGYLLWIASILSVIAIAYFYSTGNPEPAEKSELAERATIASYRDQIDALSADLLKNQRALKNAEKDLLQLNSAYEGAVEEIRRLQARP
jgi:hypothetical protein